MDVREKKYEEPLHQYRWVDGTVAQQKWLIQNGPSYTGSRKGATDILIKNPDNSNLLLWIPVREEWREKFEKAPYF